MGHNLLVLSILFSVHHYSTLSLSILMVHELHLRQHITESSATDALEAVRILLDPNTMALDAREGEFLAVETVKSSHKTLLVYRNEIDRRGEGRRRVRSSSASSSAVATRYRMGASLATGLVGMEQNVLLGEFFHCLAYLPLVSDSDVRGAMVEIMSCGRRNRPPRSRTVMDGHLTHGRGDSFCGNVTTSTRVPSYALVCKFWCAVAMGGLLQGRSEKMVAGYVRHAEDALSSCEGTVAVETARALGAIAVLYGLLGRDQDYVEEYLERRVKMIEELEAEESTHFMRKEFALYARPPASGKAMVEQMIKLANFYSSSDQQSRRPVSASQFTYLTEETVHAQVAHITSRTWSTLIRTMAKACQARTGHGVARPVPGSHTSGIEGAVMGSSRLLEPTTSQPRWSPTSYATLPAVVHSHMDEIEQLKKWIGRPSPQRGLGVPLQAMLSITCAAVDDREGVIEAVYRCAAIFIRYPGLGRFSSYHGLYTRTTLVLASIGDYATYGELAAGFNALGLGAIPPIPPLEERFGCFLCDHGLCRLAELFLRKHGWGPMFMSSFSHSLVGPRCGNQLINESHVSTTHRHTAKTKNQEVDPCTTSPGGSGSSYFQLSSTEMVSSPHHHQVPDGITESDWDGVFATLSRSTQEPSPLPSDVPSLGSDEISTQERLLYSR